MSAVEQMDWPLSQVADAKIADIVQLVEISKEVQRDACRIVHAHGAFDLLHLGHVRHLQAAKRMGDILIVTITPDCFVNKGPGRPVFNESLRAEMLAAIDCVDYVAINDAPDAVETIRRLKPDIYVKGQDYQNPEGDITGKIAREREAVEARGHFRASLRFE